MLAPPPEQPVDPHFYHQGGAVPPGAPSYVIRQADAELHAALMQREFCYVLTARQMGKSSLMGHTAARLREEGVAVVRLDLTAIGQNITPEQWYVGLLDHLGRQLDLEDELEEFWLAPSHLGPLQRWITALREVVLPKAGVQAFGRSGVQVPTKSDPSDPSDPERLNTQDRRQTALAVPPERPSLVIFIDEIDFVRSLPFRTDELFAAIRECYNRRVDDPEFARLTFCLLGVATPSDLIQDTRTSPFNIGRRIDLADFTEAEAAPLAAGLLEAVYHEAHEEHGQHEADGAGKGGGPGQSAAPSLAARHASLLLQRVLYWTHGHPYLTQRLCQAIATETAGNPKSKIQNPKSKIGGGPAVRRAVPLPPVPRAG